MITGHIDSSQSNNNDIDALPPSSRNFIYSIVRRKSSAEVSSDNDEIVRDDELKKQNRKSGLFGTSVRARMRHNSNALLIS
jgi:hypothetical protein